MRRALSRLRWQLTLSHLVAIAVTLVSMIAAVVLIGTSWFAGQTRPAREPAQAARLVAQAVGGMVARGDPADLSGVLRGLADGDLQLVFPFGPSDRRPPGVGLPSVQDIRYIVVVGADGSVLGSSDPSGAAFAPPERGEEWGAIAAQALATGADTLTPMGSGAGPAVFGASTIQDDAGRRVAAVLVGLATVPQPASVLDVWHTLAIFGAASVAVLFAASLFALAASSLVAYVLSRRLVDRLERLGRAVEALASGDLTARASIGGEDEVGRLGERFDHMAGDLERTLNELESERDRVASLLAARRQLVAGVSHELRTPISVVRAYMEAALGRDGAVPTDLRSDLETMERELNRLQALIEDLFTLSRAEVGRLELRPKAVDVGSVVRRLAETVGPLAWQQRRVEVLAQVARGVPPAVADEQRLEQIVSNLLGNAVRHTPPGGIVAAGVEAEKDAVRVEVRDTGEGISSEDLPRVFERFYRGRGEDGDGGAGLGLALVKELAETMGGSVSVESTPGEGSTFRVRLPRA